MSGGGNGGTKKSGKSRKRINCRDITFNTHLSSPVATVFAKLKPGDILEIDIDSSGALVAYYDGVIAGSITHSVLADILACIEQGEVFVAEIISISGGHCVVKVQVRGGI